MLKFLLNRFYLAFVFLFLCPALWAQSTSATSVDNAMRSHDKIFVVMAVCIVILVVFFLYLIRIDRKVSKKEKSV